MMRSSLDTTQPFLEGEVICDSECLFGDPISFRTKLWYQMKTLSPPPHNPHRSLHVKYVPFERYL